MLCYAWLLFKCSVVFLMPISFLMTENGTNAFWGVFRGHPKTKHTDTTLPKIHVYGFSKAQDPEFDFHEVFFLF